MAKCTYEDSTISDKQEYIISVGAGEDNSFTEKPTIVEQLKPNKIKEIRGGNHHSIACTEDGKLLIWGRCDEDQAGINLDDLDKENLVFDFREKPRILEKSTVIPNIEAVFVAAAIDNSIAITEEGKVYSGGFSENYRTGLGTQKTVKIATLIEEGDTQGKRLCFAGCGDQFSVVAGPAEK